MTVGRLLTAREPGEPPRRRAAAREGVSESARKGAPSPGQSWGVPPRRGSVRRIGGASASPESCTPPALEKWLDRRTPPSPPLSIGAQAGAT